MRLLALVLISLATAPAADLAREAQILRTAGQSGGAKLKSELADYLGANALADGVAVQNRGLFLFAIESAMEPRLFVDDEPANRLNRAKGADLWFAAIRLETGRSHAFYFTRAGEMIGKRNDVRGYAEAHYPRPDVPRGVLSEKFVHTSKLYPGMESEWWFYVSPGVKPGEPAPLMVWQDGQGFAKRDSNSRLFTVTENLVADGKIPPMAHLLIAPGMVGDKRMRSIEYDTVTDLYARFVVEEILPLLEQHQKIRSDAYSRAIGGQSSGGICAFNAAWFKPDWFSRVVSRVGSFTAIAWRSGEEKGPDVLDGGHFYPSMVRKAEKRNIRVWMEDGWMDLENSHGSWPLQNIQLANSLKMREYDFRFSFGNAQHGSAHGDSKLPESLAWVWRGYDPAKTEQVYEMDPAEQDKPYFRVLKLNRSE